MIYEKYLTTINLLYILAFLFIFIGNRLIANDTDVEVFFVFWELLYIPIVFGLPILGIILLWHCYRMEHKSFKVYLCMGLAFLAEVLFVAKMYFGIVEEVMIF
jgi:hypothetical protein